MAQIGGDGKYDAILSARDEGWGYIIRSPEGDEVASGQRLGTKSDVAQYLENKVLPRFDALLPKHGRGWHQCKRDSVINPASYTARRR